MYKSEAFLYGGLQVCKVQIVTLKIRDKLCFVTTYMFCIKIYKIEVSYLVLTKKTLKFK